MKPVQTPNPLTQGAKREAMDACSDPQPPNLGG